MTSPARQELIQIQGAPFQGTAAYDSNLLTATGVGEGVWVPTFFIQEGSIDIEGAASAFSVQLLGSNALSDPGNSYTATIGGTVTTGDVVTINFTNPNLNTVPEPVAYTTIGGDTTSTIATALAAAINADAKLAALGFAASPASAVITITYPSFPPGNDGSQEGGSQSNPAYQNFTTLSATVSGGATETVAFANASTGANIGSAITTKGMTALTPLPKWLKAVLASITGSPLTVNLHGVG